MLSTVPSDGQYELTCVGTSDILTLDRPPGINGLEISGRPLGHHVTVVVHMFIIHLSGGKTFWRCC